MLQPKRTKYRKQFKGRNAGLAQRGSNVSFGEFGLKATSRARMTAREIEAARRAMARYVKRGGQIWIRVFPDVPISKKPLEVRMGSGKGNVEYYVARVKPGKVLFEMEGVDEVTAREAFRLAGSKLSVSTTFVKRQVRKEQFALRMQRATGQAPKPDQFQKVRRNIARLKTVQREVALKAATGEKK
jgi:large subunit ribosomal protein L16